jgi:3-oxoacyl-[acyl-carrier-protein] synthase II
MVVLRPGPEVGMHTRPRIISYGCSNDANHISGPSRDGGGLALAIERALVGVDRREIRAICAHGTATQYNDAMEARAFHTVFGGSPPPVFGIKGAIGHTLGAAGLIEVIISAKVAVEGVIPPTTGFEQGETDFPLDVVHGKPRKIKPGLVLTTNSGFGGMNTAIIVGPGSA